MNYLGLPFSVFVAFAKLRKATISFVMSIRLSVCLSVHLSAWKNWTTTGRVLMKLDFFSFLQKSVQKIQISVKSNKKNGYFT
jgi:hypothetical protein